MISEFSKADLGIADEWTMGGAFTAIGQSVSRIYRLRVNPKHEFRRVFFWAHSWHNQPTGPSVFDRQNKVFSADPGKTVELRFLFEGSARASFSEGRLFEAGLTANFSGFRSFPYRLLPNTGNQSMGSFERAFPLSYSPSVVAIVPGFTLKMECDEIQVVVGTVTRETEDLYLNGGLSVDSSNQPFNS